MPARQRSVLKRIITNDYVVGSFCTIGGILFGCDISSMSGQLSNPHYLKQYDNPQGVRQGAITASMAAGSFLGALVNSWLADAMGRRWCIILSGLIWTVGCIIQAAAPNLGALIPGRIIAGLGVGLASSLVPIYQAEVTKPAIRGRMVSLQQWAITWGIFLQFFVQYGCSYIDGQASFRLPWALQIIPGLILSAGMLLFPESPRWLMDHDREAEALSVLADLHGEGDANAELVQLEYNEIKAQVDFDRTLAAKSYLDLLKPGVFRRVFLGMSVQMWSQLTGMNVIMYYVVYVFQSAGLTGAKTGLVASSIQYAFNVAFTLPAILCIDKVGRRPLMLGGAAFMSFFLFLIGGLQQGFGMQNPDPDAGTTTWIISGHRSVTIAIIACSYMFVISFATTWGPCSWTVPSELFDTRTRAKAVSMSTATNWAFNFALGLGVPPGFETIQYKTYYIFATFNAAAFLHTFFCIPETKGRTLEEMEEVFKAGHVWTAWRIKSDVGRKTVAEAALEAQEAAVAKGSLEIAHDEKIDEKTQV